MGLGFQPHRLPHGECGVWGGAPWFYTHALRGEGVGLDVAEWVASNTLALYKFPQLSYLPENVSVTLKILHYPCIFSLARHHHAHR